MSETKISTGFQPNDLVKLKKNDKMACVPTMLVLGRVGVTDGQPQVPTVSVFWLDSEGRGQLFSLPDEVLSKAE
jgi:hypothetical protein